MRKQILKKMNIWIFESAGNYQWIWILCSNDFEIMLDCECVSVRIPFIACSKFDVRKQLICQIVKPTDRKRINCHWEKERKIYVFVAWMDLLRPFAKIYDLMPRVPAPVKLIQKKRIRMPMKTVECHNKQKKCIHI